ncbi:hypothetical protein [Chrysiogenes arsenatis]|uniref:hypothetical protein n=1 Tax=Chrysiogenes arsenatis TaxID=309797 RepID=UPI0003FC274F|nr:hypothetical protein [Chrysiogenes arsenatis]
MELSTLSNPYARQYPNTAMQQGSSQSLSGLVASDQKAKIEVQTKEGDRVTITMARQSQSAFGTYSANGTMAGGAYQKSGSLEYTAQRHEFSFEVEGDLSDEERQEIEALTSRLGAAADEFFAGKPMNLNEIMGFKANSLGSFRMELEETKMVALQSTRSQVGAEKKHPLMERFAEEGRTSQDRLGTENNRFKGMLGRALENAFGKSLSVKSVLDQVMEAMAQQRTALEKKEEATEVAPLSA